MKTDFSLHTKENKKTESDVFMIKAFYKAYKNILNIYKENVDSVDDCNELHKLVNLFFEVKAGINRNESISELFKKEPLIERMVVCELLKEIKPDTLIDGHKASFIQKENNKLMKTEYENFIKKKSLCAF